jgi:hypothetical protein
MKSALGWWHQQEEAQDLIEFNELLGLITARFEAMDGPMQELMRPDFDQMRVDIESRIGVWPRDVGDSA